MLRKNIVFKTWEMSWENVIVEFYFIVKTFASKNLLKLNPTADIF